MISVASLTAAMYPGVSGVFKDLAERFTLWSFSADDELDRCQTEQEAEARASELRRGSELVWLLSAFDAVAPRRQSSAFASHVDDFLAACVWEASNRRRLARPAFDIYRRMRPHTGAMWPFLRLALAATDVTLEQEQRVRPILEAVVWLPCLANDLVSAEKELQSGDFHNAVILSMREHGLDLATARSTLDRAYADERKAFELALERASHVLTAAQRVALYALVAGANQWLSDSTRYSTPSAEASFAAK